MSPASLELALRNATSAALQTFVDLAPAFGGATGSSWLQPYVDRLRESLAAEQHTLRQQHEHAQTLASVTRRIRAESAHAQEELRREMGEAVAAAEAAVRQEQLFSRKLRMGELAGNIALLAIGAGSMLLPPGGAFQRVAPLLQRAPTIFAMLGVYRVAQRSLSKMASVAVGGARRLWKPVEAIVSQAMEGGDPVLSFDE